MYIEEIMLFINTNGWRQMVELLNLYEIWEMHIITWLHIIF